MIANLLRGDDTWTPWMFCTTEPNTYKWPSVFQLRYLYKLFSRCIVQIRFACFNKIFTIKLKFRHFVGHPKPNLVWWFNNTILDNVVDSNRGSKTTVNQLLISSVNRNLKGGRLECRASSSQVAGSIVRLVPLNIFRKYKSPMPILFSKREENQIPNAKQCESQQFEL